jgi:hypothetical protein
VSDAVVKLARNRKHPPGKGEDPPLSPNETKALAKMRAEAKEKGVTLATGGKGGLPPSLVLGVFRRDGWKCKECGGQKMLSVHHKGGTPNLVSRALRSNKGHSNDPSNVVSVCEDCHDDAHEEQDEKND